MQREMLDRAFYDTGAQSIDIAPPAQLDCPGSGASLAVSKGRMAFPNEVGQAETSTTHAG